MKNILKLMAFCVILQFSPGCGKASKHSESEAKSEVVIPFNGGYFNVSKKKFVCPAGDL